jgi:hypothetical protein
MIAQALSKNYTLVPYNKHRFYENFSYFTFSFTQLKFWQVLELKNFAAKTSFVVFENYGFNGEKNEGRGSLNISRLKEWTKDEVAELEEILGKGMSNFWSFLP